MVTVLLLFLLSSLLSFLLLLSTPLSPVLLGFFFSPLCFVSFTFFFFFFLIFPCRKIELQPFRGGLSDHCAGRLRRRDDRFPVLRVRTCVQYYTRTSTYIFRAICLATAVFHRPIRPSWPAVPPLLYTNTLMRYYNREKPAGYSGKNIKNGIPGPFPRDDDFPTGLFNE